MTGAARACWAGNVFLDPFVLRALGLVRDDAATIDEALARFEALGLEWHAAQTRALP